ncbi:CRM-domain containing factor CFM9, mitochondrial isoform X2 [Macadamia integrifolia]|uniref:CRM-domain containing factor CFM9, mitochondrial isoform X2 n=1 Tax=Macadamia integrifolia TaxID=60698 RepID=UPI001C4EF8C3|nr:CRM-domain containing factor CFM9, mitochondrial isoform X2 [Macadamia integrifolia]
MSMVRNIQRLCFRTLSSLLPHGNSGDILLVRDGSSKMVASSNLVQSSLAGKDCIFSSFPPWGCFVGSRFMSAKPGRSMRSKVEKRLRFEAGKPLRERRRAAKLRKKLMTDEERLIYNLRRAKKKVALLLQKLKKYELPELPPPRHDPELLTYEQLQAYKKIGFRNRNYVPVGVRGVFGGVVQNMHLHWKFHETVQVCCDNFPKEKIKEMATMLARLSGGIVVNIHDVKTIIMFRGRNYRQPKNLIPINTLTKRKALFKARFEQALDSQKLNIKKYEQQLRRMGVNPEDPVAMASIQRVASTFFNAIDNKERSPYVFHGDRQSAIDPDTREDPEKPSEDSDQEELDRFIADIEDAANQEWEEEEAKEKEEMGRMRYRNREDWGGRSRTSYISNGDSEDETTGRRRDREDTRGRHRTFGMRKNDSDHEDEALEASGDEDWDSHSMGDAGYTNDALDSDEDDDEFKGQTIMNTKQQSEREKKKGFEKNVRVGRRGKNAGDDSGSENMFGDLENELWDSGDEEEHDSIAQGDADDFMDRSDEEEGHSRNNDWQNGRNRRIKTVKQVDETWDSD